MHLFSGYDLTVALSHLSEWRQSGPQLTTDAYAYGVIHQPYGGDEPLLPAVVQFCFSPSRDGQLGHGSVGKKDWVDPPYYMAEIFIFDPDRKIFEGFQKAFEHALISGFQYAYLVLRRDRPPYISDHEERDAAFKAERETMAALMQQVEAGEGRLPEITFAQIAYNDALYLKAPSWSHDWHTDDDLKSKKYHSQAMADWRNQSWRS